MSKDNSLVRREGRPSKLSKELIHALENVAESKAAVILTDQELVEHINDTLPPDKRISYPTFRNYKDGNYEYNGNGESKYLSEFLSIIKRLRRFQKMAAFNRLQERKAGDWQKEAWIMERKFPDLNLTRKVDHTTGGDSFNKIVIEDAFEEIEEAEIIKDDEEE